MNIYILHIYTTLSARAPTWSVFSPSGTHLSFVLIHISSEQNPTRRSRRVGGLPADPTEPPNIHGGCAKPLYNSMEKEKVIT